MKNNILNEIKINTKSVLSNKNTFIIKESSQIQYQKPTPQLSKTLLDLGIKDVKPLSPNQKKFIKEKNKIQSGPNESVFQTILSCVDGTETAVPGSMVQDVEQPKDMDLMLVGELTNTSRIYEMLNYLTHIGVNEIKVPTDALFIEDITYLSIHPKRQTIKVYDVYTCYNFELEIVKGEITKFRDFNKNDRVGLLTKHQFHQPSIKALERGYLPNKHFYLTSP